MSDITTRAGKGEPLTHPEVDANFTNLNADKYQAGDNPSFGNITVTGTVDGRDVAADGSKLDGIEANADVTDTANVEAAGALMDSELTSEASVKALDQGVATTDSPTFAGLTADTVDITGGTISGTDIDMTGTTTTWPATALGVPAEPTIYTSSGTYTPTAGARYALVEAQGAGGAGGGVNGVNNDGSGAPGGCGGAWCRFVVDLTALTGNPTITIGAAGTGAVAASGTTGGDTSYDDTLVGGTHNITAHGGPGGQNPGNVSGERIHDPNYTIPVATATSGSILTSRPGVAGDIGIVLRGSGNGSDVAGGCGGDSLYGAGGKWTSNNTSGENATGYGAAGSGANQGGNDNTNRAGGDGADGIVIITEFF